MRSCASWRRRLSIGGQSGSGCVSSRDDGAAEVLGWRGDDVDWDGGTVRIDEGLIEVRSGIAWSDGKTVRSRRVIPADPVTMRGLVTRRRQQAKERLLAGPAWVDND